MSFNCIMYICTWNHSIFQVPKYTELCTSSSLWENITGHFLEIQCLQIHTYLILATRSSNQRAKIKYIFKAFFPLKTAFNRPKNKKFSVFNLGSILWLLSKTFSNNLQAFWKETKKYIHTTYSLIFISIEFWDVLY